jgi:ribosome biogenesis GTPase
MELGWNAFFQNQLDADGMTGAEVGRIAVENRNNYLLYTRHGELTGEATGRLLFSSEASELPKVGDWVIVTVFEDERKAIIHRVLKRRTAFYRKSAGVRTEMQVIAANIDLLFIVQGLDNNYNPRRLERYLVMAGESGASPVAVLNKADLCPQYREYIDALGESIDGVPVHAVSAATGEGLDALRAYLREGVTVAFVGSSGVGKSTIINALLGADIQVTGEVRADDSRGRHITTRRELLAVPGGGLLIDTPGMRELGLWNAEAGIGDAFADIGEFARGCKYADCTHTVEAGCAVIAAVERGEVSRGRYDNYIKMRKELAFLESRQDRAAFLDRKKREKDLGKEIKRVNKILHKRRFFT